MKINANDYKALKALYDRTDGENWTKKTNWDVSNNNLSGTLPSFLGDLSNLRYL